jgi:putative redox protein
MVNSGLVRYAQNISVGLHLLQADEPRDSSGHDVGPNPYELLLSALGACTSVTLRMYAERKQWPLQGVQLRLAHS